MLKTCWVVKMWSSPPPPENFRVTSFTGTQLYFLHINYLCVFRLNALSKKIPHDYWIAFHTLNLKFPFSQYHSYYPQLQKTKILFTVTFFFNIRPRINVVTLISHKGTSNPWFKMRKTLFTIIFNLRYVWLALKKSCQLLGRSLLGPLLFPVP